MTKTASANKINTPKARKASSSAGNAKHVGAAGMKVLNQCAALKAAAQQDEVERAKLSTLTGILGKSTIANALTKLKNEGWLVVTAKTVTITEAGMEAADADEVAKAVKETPTSNAEYRQQVAEVFKIKERAMQLVNFLDDGGKHTKLDCANAISCKLNSTFSNHLTSLKKAGMIEFDAQCIWLTDKMFPFEKRAE